MFMNESDFVDEPSAKDAEDLLHEVEELTLDEAKPEKKKKKKSSKPRGMAPPPDMAPPIDDDDEFNHSSDYVKRQPEPMRQPPSHAPRAMPKHDRVEEDPYRRREPPQLERVQSPPSPTSNSLNNTLGSAGSLGGPSAQSRARVLQQQRELQMKRRQQAMMGGMMRSTEGHLTPSVRQFSAPRDVDPYSSGGPRRPATSAGVVNRDEGLLRTAPVDPRFSGNRPTGDRPSTGGAMYSPRTQDYGEYDAYAQHGPDSIYSEQVRDDYYDRPPPSSGEPLPMNESMKRSVEPLSINGPRRGPPSETSPRFGETRSASPRSEDPPSHSPRREAPPPQQQQQQQRYSPPRSARYDDDRYNDPRHSPRSEGSPRIDERYNDPRDDRYAPRRDPRDDRYAPRDDRYNDPRDDRYAPRDDRYKDPRDVDRYPPRDDPRDVDRYPPRDDVDRYPPRDDVDRYPPRDDVDRYPPRDDVDRYPPRDDRYPPRDDRYNDPRYRDDRYDPRDDRYPPRDDPRDDRYNDPRDVDRYPPRDGRYNEPRDDRSNNGYSPRRSPQYDREDRRSDRLESNRYPDEPKDRDPYRDSRRADSPQGKAVDRRGPPPGEGSSEVMHDPTAVKSKPDRSLDSGATDAESWDIDALDLDKPSNLRKFLMAPIPPEAGVVQCYIKRNKSGTKKMFPEYRVFMKVPQEDRDMFLMIGKKRSGQKTSNYLISMSEDDLRRSSTNYLGKLRSNFVGTEFRVYDNGSNPEDSRDDDYGVSSAPRVEMGVVQYESNVLGSRGPRRMQVGIPKVDDRGISKVFQPRSSKDSMMNKFKKREFKNLLVAYNKPPRWNEQVGAFVLNFNGRVTMASVKNFQLITHDDQERVLLQFGRIAKDEFTMDFQYPFSPFQAFAITLSSFDSKIACD